jgi:hypothetical protein
MQASRSMLISGARGAPLFEVGPAPSDGAWAQVHGTRELAAGDQAVDGRSAQAGGLHHRRQAREQLRRAGGAARRGCEAIHASRRAIDVRSVGAVTPHQSDDSLRRVIGRRPAQCTEGCSQHRRWNRPRFQQAGSIGAALSYAKAINLGLNSHVLRHGSPRTPFIGDRLETSKGVASAPAATRSRPREAHCLGAHERGRRLCADGSARPGCTLQC